MSTNKVNQSELILDAAYKCVSEKGYANISLRDIAKEANVALSQLHYYFGSKKELFQEVIKRMIKKYLTEFEHHLRNSKSDKKGIARVFSFVEDLFKYKPELFKILFDLSSLALRSQSFKALMTDLFDDLSVMIEECIEESKLVKKEFKGISTNTLSRTLLGAIIGIAFQYTLDPNRNEEILKSLDALSVILE